MSHEWTMKFVQHRVADHRILRLIQKWLKAGVSEDGQWSETKVGTPQGAVMTPRTQTITDSLGGFGGTGIRRGRRSVRTRLARRDGNRMADGQRICTHEDLLNQQP
jgi:hypothetical protein